MLEFSPISCFEPGSLMDILHRSYAALVEERPKFWKSEEAKWDDFDRQAFAHPDTIGKCVFVSRLASEASPAGMPVGLASYDPRRAPDVGIVGQNCILPGFRGRGFGTAQIVEILKRFRQMEIVAARVTTSEHPFFAAAVKMYLSLGFIEVRRISGGPDPRYRLIELELNLAKNGDGPHFD